MPSLSEAMRLPRLPLVPGALLVLGGLVLLLGLWEGGRSLAGPAGQEFVGPGPVPLSLAERGRYTLWVGGTSTAPAPHPATIRATLTDPRGERLMLSSLSSIERRSDAQGRRIKVGHFFVREAGVHSLVIEQPGGNLRYALEPTRVDDHATRAFLGLFFGGVLAFFSGAWLLVRGRGR